MAEGHGDSAPQGALKVALSGTLDRASVLVGRELAECIKRKEEEKIYNGLFASPALEQAMQKIRCGYKHSVRGRGGGGGVSWRGGEEEVPGKGPPGETAAGETRPTLGCSISDTYMEFGLV